MAVAKPGQLNLEEPPPNGGSRNVACFQKLEVIGEGTFGQVYRAKEIGTDEIVALKRIRMDGPTQEHGFPMTAIREIKILKMLHHENIIHLKEVVTSSGREGPDEVDKQEKPGPVEEDTQEKPGQEGPDEDKQEKPDKNIYKDRATYMVFEYMDHDLYGLANRPGMKFTVPQIKCYMKQLLTGLQYCHRNRVLHRDIKGANLLINNKGSLKLADFGLARWFPTLDVTNATNRVITLYYRPPELLLGSVKYGSSVDIWSVGCVFAELLNGKPILPGTSEIDQLNKIYQLCGTPDKDNSLWSLYEKSKLTQPLKSCLRQKFKHFDHLALELVEKMLVLDPKKRITPANALADAYFSTDPLPCDPKSLPTYDSSHDLKIQKIRKRMREEEAAAKEQQMREEEEEAKEAATKC